MKKEVNKEFTYFDFYYTVDFLKLAYSFFKNAWHFYFLLTIEVRADLP